MRRAQRFVASALILMLFLSLSVDVFAARRTPEWSETLVNNARLAEELALEGIILLENNGALPLKEKSVALFGVGAVRT